MTLSVAPTVTLAAIEAAVPELDQAKEIVDAFHTLICRKLEAASPSSLRSRRASDTSMPPNFAFH